MTGKAEFTAEEWKTILEGPPAAGMMVVTAGRGGTIKEVFAIGKAYAEARKQQDLDMYLTVVGEATGLLHDRPSAASIIDGMVTQAESLLKRGASLDFRSSKAAS